MCRCDLSTVRQRINVRFLTPVTGKICVKRAHVVKWLHHVQFRFKEKRVQQQYRLFRYILVLELKLLRPGLTEWRQESANRISVGQIFVSHLIVGFT